MVGIYKITTPSNKVYIGQSVNIKKRFSDHKWPVKKSISLISRSVLKYGHSKHKFEVIHELPQDCSKKVLCVYESLYMDLYRSCGFHLLNIADSKESNFGYKQKPEQIESHRQKLKGRPGHRKGCKHTEDTKKIIKEKRAKQTNVQGIKKGNVPWNKGTVGVCKSWSKGIPCSEEAKAKISAALSGKKLSPESIAKRTATLKKNGVKRKWSEEAKKKQSEKITLVHKIRKANAFP